MPVSPESLALLSALLSAVITIVVTPQVARYGSLAASAVLMGALGAMLVGLGAALRGRVDLGPVPWQAAACIVLGTAPGLAVATWTYWESVRCVGASVAYPIANGYPALVSLAAVLLLGERITLARVAGTAAVIAGVTLISTRPGAAPLTRQKGVWGRGILMALLTAALWTSNTLLMRFAMAAGVQALTATMIRVPTIALLLGSAALARRPRGPTLTPRSLRILVGMALLRGISDVMYFHAVATGNLSVVVPLSSLSPLFAMPMAVIFLKERVTLRMAIGAAVAVLGVAVLA